MRREGRREGERGTVCGLTSESGCCFRASSKMEHASSFLSARLASTNAEEDSEGGWEVGEGRGEGVK